LLVGVGEDVALELGGLDLARDLRPLLGGRQVADFQVRDRSVDPSHFIVVAVGLFSLRHGTSSTCRHTLI
jgi:hypothetical protein